jgi:hypothetical protein
MLAHGLGQVLGDFCVFNGRLIKRGLDLYIECNDIGVAFSVVRSDVDMRTTLGQIAAKSRQPLIDLIDPKRAIAKGEPVLTVRITQFTDAKSCLGVCLHHSVGDMHSFMGLMHAWSRSVTGVEYAKPLVVEDRVAYLEQALPHTSRAEPGLRCLGLADMASFVFYKLTEARDKRLLSFYFGSDELERLRASLQSELGERLSINDALCAHLFSLIAGRDPKARPRYLSIAVDYRKRVGLPENLLGNMVTNINCLCEPGKAAGQIAGGLRRAADRFVDEHMDYRSNMQFIESHGGAKRIGRFVAKGIDPMGGALFVTNLSKVGVYEITFGGNSPTYFAPTGGAPFPWVSTVYEGFHNRGAVFEVGLPRVIAGRLVSDTGLREVHRFREVEPELPEIAKSMPEMW